MANRQIDPMKPTMMSRVRSYLEQRRRLGFKLLNEGSLLENFARFADRSGHRCPLTKELAIRWAALSKGSDQLWRARRLEVVRTFAKYLIVSEPQTQIPPRHVFGPAHRRSDPYIYSPEEVRELMRRSKRLSGPLRGQTYSTLIGLLACTGLRISEALRLTIEDVDLDEGVLRVRESKYRRTRLVPLHSTAIAPLRDYAIRRLRIAPLATVFFPSNEGTELARRNVDHTFSRLRFGIGTERHRLPRLYDLRHTFVCRVLLRWENSARGAAGRVGILSRYLGHAHVTDTYWYLSAMPELMAQAGRAFANYRNEK